MPRRNRGPPPRQLATLPAITECHEQHREGSPDAEPRERAHPAVQLHLALAIARGTDRVDQRLHDRRLARRRSARSIGLGQAVDAQLLGLQISLRLRQLTALGRMLIARGRRFGRAAGRARQPGTQVRHARARLVTVAHGGAVLREHPRERRVGVRAAASVAHHRPTHRVGESHGIRGRRPRRRDGEDGAVGNGGRDDPRANDVGIHAQLTRHGHDDAVGLHRAAEAGCHDLTAYREAGNGLGRQVEKPD
jgi:hypothetical protein